MNMTKEEVAKIVKDLYKKKGKYLIQEDLRKAGIAHQFRVYFGKKLAPGLKSIGIPCSPLAEKYDITPEQLGKYLKELGDKLGDVPDTFDITTDTEIYKKYVSKRFSHKIFQGRFGGFPQALKYAGFTKDSRGYVTDKKREDENIQNNFTNKGRFYGEGAEYHVVAELLYNGFQAANIPVDEGLDVLAFKNNQYYYIQVKHKNLDNNKPITFKKTSHEKRGSNMYYIFVLLSENIRKFIILPYHIVDNWITQGSIKLNTGNEYEVDIRFINEEYRIKDIPLTKYLNKWETIR